MTNILFNLRNLWHNDIRIISVLGLLSRCSVKVHSENTTVETVQGISFTLEAFLHIIINNRETPFGNECCSEATSGCDTNLVEPGEGAQWCPGRSSTDFMEWHHENWVFMQAEEHHSTSCHPGDPSKSHTFIWYAHHIALLRRISGLDRPPQQAVVQVLLRIRV